MTDIERVLRSAELLIAEGLLSREPDPRQADVLVDGCGFRYLPAFWEKIGVLVTNEPAGISLFEQVSATDARAARLNGALEWVAVGAPFEWARQEADATLEHLLAKSNRLGLEEVEAAIHRRSEAVSRKRE